METFDRPRLIEILSRKAAGGRVTAAESEYMERWCASSAANEAIRSRIMNGNSLKKYSDAPDTKAMLRGIDKKLAKRSHRRIVAVVASAAAAVAVGFFLTFGPDRQSAEIEIPGTAAILTLADGREVSLSESDGEEAWRQHANVVACEDVEGDTLAAPVKITIPHGGKYKLRLDDGTLVWLDEESVFEYPGRFTGGAREVGLVGRAYFDVSSDAGRPFTVTTTDEIRVSVLGTQFDVDAYEDLSSVKVTLVEGSVKVAGRAGEVTLTPDRQAVFDRRTGALSVAVVEASRYTEWILGMFHFEHTPLGEVLDAIAEWYGIEIVYDAKSVRRFGTVNFHAVRYADHGRVLGMLSEMTNVELSVKE